MNVLLTGYSGFVGSKIVERLIVKPVLLGRSKPEDENINYFYTNFESMSDYSTSLNGIDVVIHCAALVHQTAGFCKDNDYCQFNETSTFELAKACSELGVKRFIFLSTAKVNGEQTDSGCAFSFADTPAPKGGYANSKAKAESRLFELALCSDLEVVVIRPPLVYGPGVKANFASLMSLVSKGIPLPFGCISNNKRSLVSVDNLVDLIITCIDHPKAANQVFLVSDDHDVSTSEMVREMAIALGKPTWQLPVPIWCYKLAGKLFNKSDVVDRLIGSLQVDISHTKETLDWAPPQTLQEGFQKTAAAFLHSQQNSGKS